MTTVRLVIEIKTISIYQNKWISSLTIVLQFIKDIKTYIFNTGDNN